MLDRLNFDGAGVVITGAAAGIGAAVAHTCGEMGAHVLAVDVDADGLVDLEKSLASSRVGCTPIVADLTCESEVARACEALIGSAPSIKALINNVGANDRRSIQDQDAAGWNAALTLNLTTAFLLTKGMIGALVAAPGGGSVVNVSSTHGLVGNPSVPSYATTKAGLLGLTRQLAAEFSPAGVRVNAVCPGLTMTDRVLARGDDGAPDHVRDRVLAGRLADPEEIANVIAFLASDAASYITGATVPVDGGFTAC